MQILSVDSKSLCQEGLRSLFRQHFAERVTLSVASSLTEALDSLCKEKFEVILVDGDIVEPSEKNALRSICSAANGARVVVLSDDERDAFVRSTMSAGASGIISKSTSFALLHASIQLVVAGGTVIPQSTFRREFKRDSLNMIDLNPTVSDVRAPTHNGVASMVDVQIKLEQLSRRQREILRMVIQGKCNKVIARDLQISEATVKGHLSAAYRSLGFKNRTEAKFAAEKIEF